MIGDKATIEKKTKFLEYFKDLPIQKLAAGFAGVSETTVGRWKKDDEDFEHQVSLAKSTWARENSKAVKSKEWLMERVMNDHFGEKKELTVNLPKPIMGGSSVQGYDGVQEDSSPEKKD